MERDRLASLAGSLIAHLDRWADEDPDRPLFRFLGARGQTLASCSYAELAERTNAVATQLQRAGLHHGQRALLVHPPGLEPVLALLACARIGVIAVPAPVSSPQSLAQPALHGRLRLLAADCEPAAVLGRGEDLPRLAGVLPLDLLATDEARHENGHGCPRLHEPHELILLQYTSGSTRAPRGVRVGHRHVIANASALLDHRPVGVSWLPQFHDMGLIGYYLFPLVTGGSTFGFAPADFLRRPALWLQTISAARSTFSSAPNFAFEYCLQAGRIEDHELESVDLSSLRVLLNGSEPVRPETMQRFAARFGRWGLRAEALVAAYGLAEATLAVTRGGRRSLALDAAALRRRAVRPDTAGQALIASSGPPVPGLRVHIVEPHSRRAASPDEVGEIWIAGDSVADGYWRDETAVFGEMLEGEALPCLRTGDLGFVHEGELYVCGRQKDLIIQRGVNIHPQDIESCITAPELRAGAVAALQDDSGSVVLLAELRHRAQCPDADVCQALLDRLMREHGLAVQRLVFVPAHSLLRTPSGKLARQRTLDRFLQGRIACIHVHEGTPVPAAEADEAVEADALLAALAREGARNPQALVGDLSLDSLALVELQLGLHRLLHVQGLAQHCDAFDGPLLQRCRATELSALLHALAAEERTGAVAQVERLLAARNAMEQSVHERMIADAALVPAPASSDGDDGGDDDDGVAVLTGATGFFGPFLLCSLLRQSEQRLLVLARGVSDEHARRRVQQALLRARLFDERLARIFDARVDVWRSDIEAPTLGLSPARWRQLAGSASDIYHNAACVDYVRTYEALRPANVHGTRGVVALALTGRRKRLHLISSTFVFGWTRQGVLLETDNNDAMQALEFGYSQSKWVAEQLALRAARDGLALNLFRPSLISVSGSASGDPHDVAARLLAFMIRYGVAVDTPNQISLLPADTVADNIAAIALSRRGFEPGARTFHVTADRYYSLTELTCQVTQDFGYRFDYHDIPHFIAELNRLARRSDPVFPLLDFFNRSAPHIAAMSLKRYCNARYRQARDRCAAARPDPTLAETAARLVLYLLDEGWIDSPPIAAAPVAPPHIARVVA